MNACDRSGVGQNVFHLGIGEPLSSAFEDGLKRMRQEGIDLCGDSAEKLQWIRNGYRPHGTSFRSCDFETTASDPRLRGRPSRSVNVTCKMFPRRIFSKAEGSRGVLEVIRFSTQSGEHGFPLQIASTRPSHNGDRARRFIGAQRTAIPTRALIAYTNLKMSSSDKRFSGSGHGSRRSVASAGEIFFGAG